MAGISATFASPVSKSDNFTWRFVIFFGDFEGSFDSGDPAAWELLLPLRSSPLSLSSFFIPIAVPNYFSVLLFPVFLCSL